MYGQSLYKFKIYEVTVLLETSSSSYIKAGKTVLHVYMEYCVCLKRDTFRTDQ